MIEQQPQPQGLLHWLRESVTVKLIFIGILVLVLLIPSAMINSLIQERAQRQDDTVKTVTDQYSGDQLIQGPVLVIPYREQQTQSDSKGQTTTTEVIKTLYVLPNELNYKGNISSEVLHRGIYAVPVYNGTINVSGNFTKADLASLSLKREQLIPEKASLLFSISDLKGLKTNPQVVVARQTLTAEPAAGDRLFANSLQVAVNLEGLLDNPVPFAFSLDIKGSQDLNFLHIGKTTDVELTGNWTSPSFGGRYLPDTRVVNDKGFSAKWRMLYYNRPFPQQWVQDTDLLTNDKRSADATFGVKFKLPVDDYQKTMRTSKYAVLIIMLTFVSLFLTEMIRKQKVHVFNYILIGAAMIIYYTLLLSFSEQVGYNIAYLIASAATIGLIATFLASLLKNGKAAVVFTFILTLFYSFIYVLIQLEDLSLLMGSIALFIIVAALMYSSRKINWDKP
ncbi:cell envelope integrity protein CreD [Mucilaginibacter ginsenosidivorans]|uniref:cell envelope integrity protein CreD n=1 Tax=Mucilaginibacter ginsenosidivorans TaxID=398053 RepID=UPI001E4CD6F4|nr:cell envelope integrity protein CreD [Mucilaginibacter ginsenosidivorans]